MACLCDASFSASTCSLSRYVAAHLATASRKDSSIRRSWPSAPSNYKDDRAPVACDDVSMITDAKRCAANFDLGSQP